MSDLRKDLYASVELPSRAIASHPQPKIPEALFHPNVSYQNPISIFFKSSNSKNTMHRC